MEIEDDPRSGRPVSKITDENIELVRTIIDEDPHSTYDDIEAETLLSHGTIFRIIHEYLKKKKITSRWVPHELTLNRSIFESSFVVNILRSSLTIRGVYVIL